MQIKESNVYLMTFFVKCLSGENVSACEEKNTEKNTQHRKLFEITFEIKGK